MDVLQSPTSLSQLAVRRCVPEALADTEERGAEWRWRDAKAFGVESLPEERRDGTETMRAMVSYDALAKRFESSDEDEEEDGIQQTELTGPVWPEMVCITSLSWPNIRTLVSYEPARKTLWTVLM